MICSNSCFDCSFVVWLSARVTIITVQVQVAKFVPNFIVEINKYLRFVKSQEKLMFCVFGVGFLLKYGCDRINIEHSAYITQPKKPNTNWISSIWWPVVAVVSERIHERRRKQSYFDLFGVISHLVFGWNVRWSCTCIIALPFTSVFGLIFECEIINFCDRRQFYSHKQWIVIVCGRLNSTCPHTHAGLQHIFYSICFTSKRTNKIFFSRKIELNDFIYVVCVVDKVQHGADCCSDCV